MYKQRNIDRFYQFLKKPAVFWSHCCRWTICYSVWFTHVGGNMTVRHRRAFYNDQGFWNVCRFQSVLLLFFFWYPLPVKWLSYYFCSRRVHWKLSVLYYVFGWMKYLNAVKHEYCSRPYIGVCIAMSRTIDIAS